jgi:hypothetical protein
LFREYLRLLSTAAALDTGVPLLDAAAVIFPIIASLEYPGTNTETFT